MRKATVSFVLSVCPSAWNNSALNGRIFMKFVIWALLENPSGKIQVYLKSDSNKRYFTLRGTAVAQWLRCCATNRKVAGSIPDGVRRIFHWHNPSDSTMALGSTQPLTEMSTRKFPGGKCGRCVRLTTLPPSCAVVMKSGNLNFLEPSGPLQACNGTALLLLLLYIKTNTYFWSYLAQFFLEWEMFQDKIVEKIKTRILCWIKFFFSFSKILPFTRQCGKVW